jgi:hypothetical protein
MMPTSHSFNALLRRLAGLTLSKWNLKAFNACTIKKIGWLDFVYMEPEDV